MGVEGGRREKRAEESRVELHDELDRKQRFSPRRASSFGGRFVLEGMAEGRWEEGRR